MAKRSGRTGWRWHMMAVTNKGGDARRAGLPREYPYKNAQRGVQRQRAAAWLEGWDCADREIREAAEQRGG